MTSPSGALVMETLLRGLRSNNNAERDEAERQFTAALAADVRSTMNELLQLVLVNPDAAMCQHGALLFRGQLQRKKTGDSWWALLAPAERENLRAALLARLDSAQTAQAKKQVADIVAQVAGMSMNKEVDEWPALLGVLGEKCMHQGDAGVTASVAVGAIEALLREVPGKFSGDIPLQLHAMLCRVMQTPPDGNRKVSVAAAAASAELLSQVPEESASSYAAAIPAMLNVVTAVADNEELLLQWCIAVMELIHSQRRLVLDSGCPGQLVRLMLEIVQREADRPEPSEDVQRQGFEVCLQTAVNIPVALKQDPELTRDVLKLCVRMMLSASDDETETDHQEGAASEDNLYAFGFRSLYILVECLSEKLTVPMLFPMIQELLAAQGDWRKERAGLTALNSLAYSGGKMMFESLPQILERLLPFLLNQDGNLTVRHAALDALTSLLFAYYDMDEIFDAIDDELDDEFSGEGSLDDDSADPTSTASSPGPGQADQQRSISLVEGAEDGERKNMQQLFGPSILRALAVVLEPPSALVPQLWTLRSKGALALAYFCSGARDGQGSEILPPAAAAEVLGRLQQLMAVSDQVRQQQAAGQGAVNGVVPGANGIASSQQMLDGQVDVADVQTSCLEAIGAIAKCLGEDFQPFYEANMTLAKSVYQLQDNVMRGIAQCELQEAQAQAQAQAGAGAGSVRRGERKWREKQSGLRGSAMMAMSYIGLAAGPEMFKHDAAPMIELVVNYMDQEWDNGDSDRKRQVATLATSICVCMGDSVDEAVLGKIIPRYLEWASLPISYEPTLEQVEQLQEAEAVNEAGEADEATQALLGHIHAVETEEGTIFINTANMKEIESAMDQLNSMVFEVGHKLMPWAGDIARVLISIIQQDVTAPDLQLFAVSCVAGLVTALAVFLRKRPEVAGAAGAGAAGAGVGAGAGAGAGAAGESGPAPPPQPTPAQREFAQTLFLQSLEACVGSLYCWCQEAKDEDAMHLEEEAMGREYDDDNEQAAIMLTSTASRVTDILRAAYESGGMSDCDVDVMCDPAYQFGAARPPVFCVPDAAAVDALMLKLAECMLLTLERPRGKSWWKESQTHEVVDSLSEAVGLLLKTHKAVALPPFAKHVMPIAKTLLDAPLQKANPQGISPQLKSLGVFFVDDAVDFGGPQALELLPVAMQYMCQYASASNHALRQGALFGIGVCAERGGEAFSPFVEAAVKALVAAIDAPGAREGAAANATDNGISALLKIAVHHAPQLVPKALAYLPCTKDPLEARIAHYTVFQLLRSGSPVFLPHVPQLKAILSAAAHNGKGWVAKEKDFDEDSALVTNATRRWVRENLGVAFDAAAAEAAAAASPSGAKANGNGVAHPQQTPMPPAT